MTSTSLGLILTNCQASKTANQLVLIPLRTVAFSQIIGGLKLLGRETLAAEVQRQVHRCVSQRFRRVINWRTKAVLVV